MLLAKNLFLCFPYDFVRLASSDVSENNSVIVAITLLRIFTHHLVETFLSIVCLIILTKRTFWSFWLLFKQTLVKITKLSKV